MKNHVNVIGGGLAGCETAWHIARQGVAVRLWEMRPVKSTPVHRSGQLAELVCSNSLKSELETTAQGLLKAEMRTLDSLILDCAAETRVPAGSALAVDREEFARRVSALIQAESLIEIIREEVRELPAGAISVIATGPLTSDTFSQYLQQLTGEDKLFFYDAVAPSLTAQSLDMNRVFKASRYGKGGEDYYNCPLSQEEYERFYDELITADSREGHSIDRDMVFEGCMPVEVMARRGKDTLRFGPMRPVGLQTPDGRRPYAVVQLRQEDRDGRIFGLVGFQTRLRWGEQDRIFRLIPGLEAANFVRYGVMHRNTYINSPALLNPTLQWKGQGNILFAGQITGVEGYMESAATGIMAGINAARIAGGDFPLVLSEHTMLGALINFITTAPGSAFQPINANFGLLPPITPPIKNKNQRNQAMVERSLGELSKFSELFLKEL